MILSPLLNFGVEIPFFFTPDVCMFLRLNIHINYYPNMAICPTITLNYIRHNYVIKTNLRKLREI